MPDAGRGTAETEWQNGVLRAARRKLSMETGADRKAPGLTGSRRERRNEAGERLTG